MAVARRRRKGRSPLTVGLIALVLVVIGVYLGFTKDIPFTHGFRVDAVFESANSLRLNSPVRIAGVNVGKVKSVKPKEGTNQALVTLEIKDSGLPIHEDATAKIRPRIFLEGNFFVDLKPGSPSAPEVSDGGVIGSAQTATPVQLDQLLTALQSDQRADLQTLLQQFGKALNSKPTAEQELTLDADVRGKTGAQGLNGSYTYAPDALRGGAIVNSALLGTEPHDLSRMIAGVARLTTALRTRERELQSLIVNFNTTAGAFASQSSALTQAVALLGPTVTAADAAFKSLDASFPATRGFARDFTPAVLETPATVEASYPWIAQTRALLRRDELGGLLAQLQPATADLARLEGESLTFLPQLDKANRCFSNTIIPAGDIGVRDGALTTRRADGSIVENYKEFWYTMVGLAGEGSNFDANGSVIRNTLGGGSYAVNFGTSQVDHRSVVGTASLPPLGTSPLYPSTPPPYELSAPCYRQALPDVNGPQAGPGRAPVSRLQSTPPPKPSPVIQDASATTASAPVTEAETP